MSFFGAIPLATNVNAGIYTAILVAGLLVVVWRFHKRDLVSVACGIIVAIVAFEFLRRWAVPWFLCAAGVTPVAALISLIHHRGRRLLMAAVVVLSAVVATGIVNFQYQLYPQVASLFAKPVAEKVSYEQLEAELVTAQKHHEGQIVEVILPGVVSGFKPRLAKVYLPPAYFDRPDLRLPVMVMLHGTPGGPEQWFDGGDAPRIAHEFQVANDGVSPILVAVDASGSPTENPICIDSFMGNVMTYLTQDVPAQIKEKFHVDEDLQHWSVVGLSYGGTCAMQIATTHPGVYGTIIDMSGEPEPSIGNHRDTVNKFFNGNEQAFNAINPVYLLEHNKYAGFVAIFIAGRDDPIARDALLRQSDAARRAGIPSYLGLRQGGHSFEVWRRGLRDVMAWFSQRAGLQNIHDPFGGITDADVHL